MKSCPKCRIRVGGTVDSCPLCQGELVGEGTPPHWPKVEPPRRRSSLLWKVTAFLLLSLTIVCVAVDLLNPGPVRWSIAVAVCVAVALVLLRLFLLSRPNLPRIMFQLLVACSALTIFCDWFFGYTGYSVDIVVPVMCTVTLALNFLLAFTNKCFAENGLVYFLLNILVGVVPYLLLFTRVATRPLAWVICLVVSIVTFLGLLLFKGRDLLAEMQKRLHM